MDTGSASSDRVGTEFVTRTSSAWIVSLSAAPEMCLPRHPSTSTSITAEVGTHLSRSNHECSSDAPVVIPARLSSGPARGYRERADVSAIELER